MRSGLFKLPQDKDVRKITKIMYPCKPDIFDKTYERVADLTEDKIGMTFGKAFEFVKQDGDNYMRLSKWAPDVKIKAWLPWPTEKDNKREMTARTGNGGLNAEWVEVWQMSPAELARSRKRRHNNGNKCNY